MLQCRWGLASLLSKQLRYLSPKSPFFLCGRDAWFSHWLWWRFSPWWCCLSPPAGIAQPVYAGLLLLSYLRSPVQMDSLCDSPIVLRSGLFRILSLDLMKSRHKRSKVRMYKGNEIFKVWIFHGLKNPPLTFSKKCPSTGGKKKPPLGAGALTGLIVTGPQTGDRRSCTCNMQLVCVNWHLPSLLPLVSLTFRIPFIPLSSPNLIIPLKVWHEQQNMSNSVILLTN